MLRMSPTLQLLDTETWGERVARARKRTKITYRDAAAIVSRVMPTSFTSLQRLEDLEETPTDAKRRMLAFCTLLVYGFDPRDFGLEASDAPPVLNLPEVRDLLIRSTGCFVPVAEAA
jgi:hypothetical protein